MVSNQIHEIVKEITYTTYGTILTDTNENLKIPFGFTGGLHDKDTNLVHNGFREYDPQTGKWTAKDPIDFSGGDTNLYGYVLNDPVNLVDPEGLLIPAIVSYAGWGMVSYILYTFAEKHLGDKACKNPNMLDVLNDAREVGKNIFPPIITHPGLGIGTKLGRNIATGGDVTMEVLK